MEIEKYLALLGNGLDQSNILVLFAIFDLILGVSYKIKINEKLTSSKMFAGIIHNFIPAFFPAIIHLMNALSKTHSEIYKYASFIIFVCVLYFIVQSILVNINLLGLKLPVFIEKWLNGEFENKIERKD